MAQRRRPRMAVVTGRLESTQAIVAAVRDRLAGHGVDIPVRLWDGSTLGSADRSYRLHVNHPWSLRALLPLTSRSVGEAFTRDDIDVSGSMVAAIRDLARGKDLILSTRERGWLARMLLRLPRPPHAVVQRRARLRGRKHSIRRDEEAVRFHYDVGNSFYQLFLDRQLVYSCAYFDEDAREAFASPAPGVGTTDPAALDARVDRAQARKVELICRKLRLRPGERLLDVGCGWGALVMHAVERFGVRAVGVTLSEEQAEWARRRISGAGLGDRAEIRVQHYREVDGAFDAIASVGMFEHVGSRQLGAYFDHLWRLTAPGGRLLNHGITTGGRVAVREFTDDRESFVAAYVFPDGALVPAGMVAQLMERAGYELLDLEQLRPHYALTLTSWVDRLERHAEEARALAGEEVYRTWRAYMAGAAVGFERGDLGVVQLLGGRDARMPLTRAHQLLDA